MRLGGLRRSRFGPQIHLLDDGFQHRRLARDFDIVLVTPEDARDRLLPAGRLREPLRALRRADAIVLAGGAAAESFPLEGKIVWRVRRGIVAQNDSCQAGGLLRDCAAAEFPAAVASGRH